MLSKNSNYSKIFFIYSIWRLIPILGMIQYNNKTWIRYFFSKLNLIDRKKKKDRKKMMEKHNKILLNERVENRLIWKCLYVRVHLMFVLTGGHSRTTITFICILYVQLLFNPVRSFHCILFDSNDDHLFFVCFLYFLLILY